jgi:hypothetical protein
VNDPAIQVPQNAITQGEYSSRKRRKEMAELAAISLRSVAANWVKAKIWR